MNLTCSQVSRSRLPLGREHADVLLAKKNLIRTGAVLALRPPTAFSSAGFDVLIPAYPSERIGLLQALAAVFNAGLDRHVSNAVWAFISVTSHAEPTPAYPALLHKPRLFPDGHPLGEANLPADPTLGGRLPLRAVTSCPARWITKWFVVVQLKSYSLRAAEDALAVSLSNRRVLDGGHGSGHRLLCLAGALLGLLDADQFGKLVPGVDTHDALCDSGRKFVGPLVDGLVRNAHRLGSRRDGAAEEFNGLHLFHAVI